MFKQDLFIRAAISIENQKAAESGEKHFRA